MGIPTSYMQNFRATKGSLKHQPERCLSKHSSEWSLSVRLSSEETSLESSHYKYSFPEYHYWSRSNEIAGNTAPGYKSTTYPNAYRWNSTALLVFHYKSKMGSLKYHHLFCQSRRETYSWVVFISDSSENAFKCCDLKKKCFHAWRWVDTASPHWTKTKKQKAQPPAPPWSHRKGFPENSV